MTKRILVIDDDQAVRKAFSLAFEDTEYRVEAAESGEKGVEMVQKAGYDLIFLDLKMPGLNGVETMRELRKTDQDVPIYIVTAFYKEFLDQLKSAEEEGINFELLKKPVGGDQVVSVARGVLEGPMAY